MVERTLRRRRQLTCRFRSGRSGNNHVSVTLLVCICAGSIPGHRYPEESMSTTPAHSQQPPAAHWAVARGHRRGGGGGGVVGAGGRPASVRHRTAPPPRPPPSRRSPRWPCWAPRRPPRPTNVAPSTVITVDLSTALASDSPMPSFTPAVAGSLVGPVRRRAAVRGRRPAGARLARDPHHPRRDRGPAGRRRASTWPRTTTVAFTVAQGSTLRLQQLLAQLGYLPVTFTPATQPTSPQQEADPQQGTFSWRWANQPASLTSLWTPGTYDSDHQGRGDELRDTARADDHRHRRSRRRGPPCCRRRPPAPATPSPTATST